MVFQVPRAAHIFQLDLRQALTRNFWITISEHIYVALILRQLLAKPRYFRLGTLQVRVFRGSIKAHRLKVGLSRSDQSTSTHDRINDHTGLSIGLDEAGLLLGRS